MDANLAVQEDYVRAVATRLLDTHGDDLTLLGNRYGEAARMDDIDRWLARPFARVTYTEAIAALRQDAARYPDRLQMLAWGDDLKHEHEAWLSQMVGKATNLQTRRTVLCKVAIRASAAVGLFFN